MVKVIYIYNILGYVLTNFLLFHLDQPFACESLAANPNSPMESTVTDLGNANRCFDQMTVKLFNNKVIPGYILHGIVYFDVSEDVRINKITINGSCNVHKSITGKNKSSSDAVSIN